MEIYETAPWGAQWQRLPRCDSETPRAWHTAVVDKSPGGGAARMITFAGEVADEENSTFNDVNLFDITNQIWFQPPGLFVYCAHHVLHQELPR